MKIWARIFYDNHMLKDHVVEDNSDDTRTHKVFKALEETCKEFDLPVPIWLDTNIREFKRRSKTRFRKESFIEEVPFDYLEFYVIEEDR